MLLLSSANFLQSFKKSFQKYYCNCQIVWIQIMPNILSGLNWVKTVCKDYQQMTASACCVIFRAFIVACFFKKMLFRKFESRSGPKFWPDLEPICLKRLSAYNYLCIQCNFSHFYIVVCRLFSKSLSGIVILSQCQTVWIQISKDVLIWVQYLFAKVIRQQTTKVVASKERGFCILIDSTI